VCLTITVQNANNSLKLRQLPVGTTRQVGQQPEQLTLALEQPGSREQQPEPTRQLPGIQQLRPGPKFKPEFQQEKPERPRPYWCETGSVT